MDLEDIKDLALLIPCDWLDVQGKEKRAKGTPRFLGWKTTWMLHMTQLRNIQEAYLSVGSMNQFGHIKA